MRVFLAILFLASVGLVTAPAQARPFFELRVCNNTSETAWIATSRIRGEHWVVSGWWDVLPYACERLGSYPKPRYFFYAYSRSLSWSGRTPLCTERGAFEYVNYGRSCDRDLIKRFLEYTVSADTTTVTLNPY